MAQLAEFAGYFAHLRSDTNRVRYPADTLHRAPHKPLLLLAVLDLFGEGRIEDGRVYAGPDVGELFSRYWYRVMPPEHRPNIALPFFHLHRDGGFWRLIATPGNQHALKQTTQIRAMTVLTELVAYAQLDTRLVECLSVPAERAVLRDVLIQTYFSAAAQSQLHEQAEINTEAYDYSGLLLGRRIVSELQAARSYRPAARTQGFRRAIVTAYDYRCAMCGIRVLTLDGRAVVEAAHIHAWTLSHNDDPTNGLALCRLCHWSFDEGLLGANRQRIIVVSPQLSAHLNFPGHLAQLDQRRLIEPLDSALAPDPDALSWHRRYVFRPR